MFKERGRERGKEREGEREREREHVCVCVHNGIRREMIIMEGKDRNFGSKK